MEKDDQTPEYNVDFEFVERRLRIARRASRRILAAHGEEVGTRELQYILMVLDQALLIIDNAQHLRDQVYQFGEPPIRPPMA